MTKDLKKQTNIAIIFAGGVGQRMNCADSTPKQFLKVNNKPIIIHTLELFQRNKNIDKIYISIVETHFEYMQELVKYYYLDKVAGITTGGVTGQDSIYKALKMAEKENPSDSIVLIHDGVRPNITQDVINKNIEKAMEIGTAITSTPSPAAFTLLNCPNAKTAHKVTIKAFNTFFAVIFSLLFYLFYNSIFIDSMSISATTHTF